MVQFLRWGTPMCPGKGMDAWRNEAMTPVLDGAFSMSQRDRAADGPSVMVLGVPWALGGPGPGPDDGPAALRAAGLLTARPADGLTPVDWGNVDVPPADAPALSGPRNAQAMVALAG